MMGTRSGRAVDRRTPRSACRALAGLVALALFAGCGNGSTEPDEPFDMREVDFAAELGVDLDAMEHLGGQLYVQDLEEGEGERSAEPADLLEVHYEGWLPDGTKFDSSRDRNEPFEFVLGQGSVIRGWDLGLEGLIEGGVRRLVIPPDLGYGATGVGPIPPNSALVFDVELLSIVRQGDDEPAASGGR